MRSDLGLTLAFASGAAVAAAAAAYLYAGQSWSWSWSWKGKLPARRVASGSLADHKGDHFGLSNALNDDILGEQFTRNLQFFGDAEQKRVFDASVAVIGLGVRLQFRCPTYGHTLGIHASTVCCEGVQGVGSHAATMLLRSGVGHIRLVDFDQARPHQHTSWDRLQKVLQPPCKGSTSWVHNCVSPACASRCLSLHSTDMLWQPELMLVCPRLSASR